MSASEATKQAVAKAAQLATDLGNQVAAAHFQYLQRMLPQTFEPLALQRIEANAQSYIDRYGATR